LGELAAIFQEEGLDDPFQGVVAAEEAEEMGLVPALDAGGLAKDGMVKDEQEAQPQDLDDDLGEEVGAERQLAEESEARERPQQPQIPPNASASRSGEVPFAHCEPRSPGAEPDPASGSARMPGRPVCRGADGPP